MARKNSVFSRRLERHYDELKWLYHELYCDEQAFGYFLEMLERCWGERKKPLGRPIPTGTAAGTCWE